MQHELFDRRVEVSFGKPGQLGRKYTDLRVKFEIEKTSNPSPNKGKISVWNMNRDSRAAAEQKGAVILLSAGYAELVEDLFYGDIAKVTSKQEGRDYVTIFETGEGENSFRNSNLSLSFIEGTSMRDVFKRVIESMGYRAGDLSAVDDENIQGGMPLSGFSRTLLDKLTKRQDLEWSIQNGNVQVLPRGGKTKQTAVLLAPDTGLVSIPRSSELAATKEPVTEAISLLQPSIVPGREFEIRSKILNGFFRTVSVKHVGDTEGKEWYSTVQGSKVKT